MITEHFGFQSLPFSKGISAENLFYSAGFKELQARLSYAVFNHQIALITGEVGTGKSTALRALKNSLEPANHCFIYISDSDLTPRSFYEYALSALAIEPPYKLPKQKELFQEAILDLWEGQGKHPVIVIDEARSLRIDMIHEIRFLTSFEMDSFSAMALILSAHPEMRSTLKLQTFQAISQRINIHYHLSGLTRKETKEYIEHQLKTANYDKPLYTDEVIDQIYKHTKGVPRSINNICSSCLLDAVINDTHLIDVTSFQRVIADLQQ